MFSYKVLLFQFTVYIIWHSMLPDLGILYILSLTPFKCINNISYLFKLKTFTKRFSQRKMTNTYPPTSVEESEPVVSHEEGTTVFTALTWQSSANIIYACIDTPYTQTEGVQQTDRLWKGFWERSDTWHINIKAYYWTICTQSSDG